MTLLQAYTDGSCYHDKGGWAVVYARDQTADRILWGYEEPATSARMELIAAIAGLVYANEPVELVADSRYALDMRMNPGFTARANHDLVALLRSLPHPAGYAWVKGHTNQKLISPPVGMPRSGWINSSLVFYYFNRLADRVAGYARKGQVTATFRHDPMMKLYQGLPLTYVDTQELVRRAQGALQTGLQGRGPTMGVGVGHGQDIKAKEES